MEPSLFEQGVKVDSVKICQGKYSILGSFYLLAHQLLIISENLNNEIWLNYSSIKSLEVRSSNLDNSRSDVDIFKFPLVIIFKDFLILKFFFKDEKECNEIFVTLQKLMNVSKIVDLYAFSYKPDETLNPKSKGTRVYDPYKEFARQGLGTRTEYWRFSKVNADFKFSPTYPSVLVVPARLSDNVIKHTGKFRSKSRIPVLSYIHSSNNISITRSSQPMVGIGMGQLKQKNRSIQDEKLVEAIFAGGIKTENVKNLIIDCRPMRNALAQSALGGGTESEEVYKNCEINFCNIENIHMIRESYNKLLDLLSNNQFHTNQMDRSSWLKHIKTLVEATLLVVKHVHVLNSNVLVHCSDGWDRTAQLTSLAEICLDPYYRTIEGFQVLIEKEWVSFGHKFRDRLGLLCGDSSFDDINSSSNTAASIRSTISTFLTGSDNSSEGTSLATKNLMLPREFCPIFTQFLDCVYQIWTQFPTHFEFNENFLISINYHLYSCQFGNFLFNNEKERTNFHFSKNPNPVDSSSIQLESSGEGTISGGIFKSSSSATNFKFKHNKTSRTQNTKDEMEIESQFNDLEPGIENFASSIWDNINSNKHLYINELYVNPEQLKQNMEAIIVDEKDEELYKEEYKEKSNISSRMDRVPSTDYLGMGIGKIQVGKEEGSPGTITSDGLILFPSTRNLKYFTKMLLRTEGEIIRPNNVDSFYPGSNSSVSSYNSNSIENPVEKNDTQLDSIDSSHKYSPPGDHDSANHMHGSEAISPVSDSSTPKVGNFRNSDSNNISGGSTESGINDTTGNLTSVSHEFFDGDLGSGSFNNKIDPFSNPWSNENGKN